MILFLLIVSLFGILLIEYISFKRDVANPVILFTLGFFVAALILSCFMRQWNVDLHRTSFYVVVLGNIGFFLGAYGCFKLWRNKVCYVDVTYRLPKLVSLKGLIFLFCIQVVVYLLRIYLLKRFYGGDLSSALLAHTMAIKFGTETAFKMPFGTSFFYGMAGLVGYVCAFLLPTYMMCKHVPFQHKFWLWANFILCLVGSLLSSGRTAMLWMIISFVSFYIIALNLRRIKVNLRVALKWFLVAFIFLFSFQQLGAVIGRDESDLKWFNEVGVYCGAELQNLDDFIEEPKFQNSDNLFGLLTFRGFYENYGALFGVNQLRTDRRDYHKFNARNGISLGNVNTALQHYWYDFGIIGTFVICLFMGLFLEYIYVQVYRSKKFWDKGCISPCLFVYSVMAPTAFMSFFSEAFFDKIVCLLDFRFWVTFVLIYVILQKNIVKTSH